MGALVSIIFIFLSCLFLYSKIMVMYYVSQVTIISNLVEGAYTHDDKFSTENGLFVAVALTEYDDERESIEDPSYG